jgi:epoxyqueuosine reductase QueG
MAVMDDHEPSTSEPSLLGRLRRSYASLAAWMVRDNRMPEPTRLPDETRSEIAARTEFPSRQPAPPRPKKNFINPL